MEGILKKGVTGDSKSVRAICDGLRWRITLLVILLLTGINNPLRAGDHFSEGNTVITHQPQVNEPWITVQVMFYDTNGGDGFFMHDKTDGVHDGPAVYIDDFYVCSPDWQLAWPGDGDGADDYLGDERSVDGWWGKTYSYSAKNSNTGQEYTVKFWNPSKKSDGRFYCDMIIFLGYWNVGETHTVKIRGMWRINKVSTRIEEKVLTSNKMPSPFSDNPKAVMSNYDQMSVSGSVNSSHGPTYIGTTAAAAPGKVSPLFSSALETKVQIGKGQSSFSDKKLNLARSKWYDSEVKPIEYVIEESVDYPDLNPGDNINTAIMKWFDVTVPGFVKAQKGSISYTTDIWNKKITLSWVADESDGRCKNGTWSIFRDGELLAGDLSYTKKSYTDSNVPDYSTDYEYKVVFVPNGSPSDTYKDELSETVIARLDPKFDFDKLTASGTYQDKIVFSWEHTSIGNASGSNPYTLTVERSSDLINWTKVKDISITNSSVKDGSIEDTGNLQSFVTYYYRLRINVLGQEYESETCNGMLSGMSYVTDFTATRGSYSNMVKLKWQVKQVGTSTTYFTLYRRPLGSKSAKDWVEIYSVSGTDASYSFEDMTAMPGSYNQYKVSVKAQVNEEWKNGLETTTDGFSVSTGIISGDITFGTGTAVRDVKVILKRQNEDGSVDRGMSSLQFTEDEAGILYATDSLEIQDLFEKDFSVQMYVNPASLRDDDEEYCLFDVDSVASIYLKYHASDTTYQIVGWMGESGNTGLYIPADKWSHLTMVYSYDKPAITFYVTDVDGTQKKATVCSGKRIEWTGRAKSARAIAIANSYDLKSDHSFYGNVDEVRFFTKALTESEIKKNFNHPLTGTEQGLAIYYPLDEGLASQTVAYDFSKKNGSSNGRHAQVMAAVSSSKNLPGDAQLSLMAYTDSLGHYEVRGIPFSGEGTGYSVIPQLGIHEFQPMTKSRYVSMNSLIHSGVDFEDVSSFPVSGKVFYAGTDYPVEGVGLYVDGIPCSKDGEMIVTAENGSYTISVPIGEHFITVRKNGHVFTNKGRYPADPDSIRTVVNFNQKISNLDFIDETLVNFTGRVVGGNIEGDKTVGFGLSNNNIGVSELVLTPVNELYRMNVVKVVNETTYSYNTNDSTVAIPSATLSINSESWRGAGFDDCRKLFIHTDPKTGEFSAMLPPLEYKIAPIKVVKSGLNVGESVVVDLSNPLLEYADTLYDDNGKASDVYKYNTLFRKTYHSDPLFTVQQDDRKDAAFGISTYTVKDALGEIVLDDIATVDNSGKPVYRFNYPVFEMAERYTFNLEAHEEYVNDDGKTPVIDCVPLSDVIVTINNALSDQQPIYINDGVVDGVNVKAGQVVELESNQIQLDSLGRAIYTWAGGMPNVSEPYTRSISMTYDIEGRVYQWSGSGMEGLILGSLSTGNNFVTSGPDMLDMILRDPPGSGSSVEWTKGTSFTSTTSSLGTWSAEVGVNTTSKLGFQFQTVTGALPGFAAVDNADSKYDLEVGVKTTTEGESGSTWSRSVEITKTITTSEDPDFVGPQGDVFIGAATNIIFGKARSVGLYRVGTSNDVSPKVDDAITTGLSFGTEFAYTQRYIENVLIPNLEAIRNSKLITVLSTDTINRGEYPIYVTTLSPDDEGFGRPNDNKKDSKGKILPSSDGPSYRWIIPEGKDKDNYQDSVMWCNDQIEIWKSHLAFNEQEKVEAYEKRDELGIDEWGNDKYKNYSFDGGASISGGRQIDSESGSTYDVSVSVGVHVGNTWGIEINKTGVLFNLSSDVGAGYHKTHEFSSGKTSAFSYTLADEGEDALTVDVYDYGAYGPIFRTRGGQTSAPYEGKEVTKYYKPGTVIMDATMQIEIPEIGVNKNVVSDIPSGSAADYILSLSNASETGSDVAYKLFMLDETNPNGAQLTIDGKVLTEGRLIKVPAGQTLTKTLQLRQTNTGILDYDRIGIVFASESQPEDIADTVFISAQFVPSSSPVTLQLSQSLINTQADTILVMTFKDFDRNYHNLKAFRIQYKKPGATDWTQLKEYVLDDKYLTESNEILPSGAQVSYSKPISFFTDGDYLFRVVSASTYGSNEEVYRYSEELPMTKDMMRPRPLGQPEPSDGVLDIGEDLSVTFNETIIKGLLTSEANFEISGVLNGAKIDHETALSLQNSEMAAATDADIMLGGKDFSIDAWINVSGAGTLLTHGQGTRKFAVGINAARQLAVSIGDTTYTSREAVPTDKWVFLTMSYSSDKSKGILNASVANDDKTIVLFSGVNVDYYSGNGPLCVGSHITGAIHELLLWDEAHDITTALLNRGNTKSPSTRHLIGYWKMNEGEGKSIRDYSRSRHMTMTDETWYLNNENKAVDLDGASYLSINASQLQLFADDDYAVEFWMRGGRQAGDAQLIQMGEVGLWLNAEGELRLTGKGAYHDNVAVTVETSARNLNDNVWHHIALNVLRQGAAAIYVDGRRCLTTGASNVGSIVTNNMIVGAHRITESAELGIYSYDRPFKGQIDEIRVWSATMNSDMLTKNRKVRLSGKETGLVAYYPFETKDLDSYNQVVTIGTPTDLVKGKLSASQYTLTGGAASSITYVDEAPAMRTKPTETNVNFTYTASNDKIVITINEDAATIEGCTLNFTVKDVSDENGNGSVAAKWSAFINCKQLVWDEDEVSIEQQVKEESSFTARIINKGGQMQMWNLSGIPEWLTASADYGVTNPRGETALTFTVKPSTPIGYYEETVYLTGNDSIDVPLTLKAKVTGIKPDWSVNPKMFENSMNIIGTLDILGVMSDDEEDIVAAFIGEECRGIAHPVYKERYDGYYITMDIYGSPDDKEPLTFRAYDASTGALYPEVTANPATAYEQLTLKGTYANPVKLTALNKIEQQTELKEGWNWLSFYVNTGDMKVASIFEKIADDVIMVKSQTGSLTYEQGSWDGDLKGNLSNGQMYAVKMKADRTLRIVGERVEPAANPITVYNGWNWIGYYGRQVSDVTGAMADLNPEDGNIIKAQSGVAYYDTYEWAGSLALMEPGVGYKLQTSMDPNTSKSFSYPSSVVNLAPMRRAAKQAPAHVGVFQPVDFRNYSGNATMAVQVYKDGIILPNAEVGVFADGECRAAAFTGADGKAYLTIPGDESVTLTFKVADGAEIMVVSDKVNFEADGIYGTPKKPVIFLLGNTPTRVVGVDADAENGQAYDLQGRKVTDGSEKGIRIIDGKKRLNR